MGAKHKIIVLDAKTIGNIDGIEKWNEFGEVITYQFTKPDEIIERITDATIVITNKVVLNKTAMDAAQNLELICVAATGMNNIDLDYAAEKGIEVKNVKGYSTDGVAQHTFALILHILNHINRYDSFVKDKSYSNANIFTHHAWPIHELASMQLGIIGFGAIGQKVAGIATAFGAKVVYYSTSGMNKSKAFKAVTLESLLTTSDIVSIHAPLNDTTSNLITYSEVQKMKKTALLVNTGRGGIINERDLAKALDEELIRAAALDVFEKEPLPEDNQLLLIRNKDRLIATPHIAWAGVESRERLVKGIYENIKSYCKKMESIK